MRVIRAIACVGVLLSCSAEKAEKPPLPEPGDPGLRGLGVTPATSGVLTRDFGLDLKGLGSNRVKQIVIEDNFGFAVVNGVSIPLLVHENTPPQQGHNVFQAVALGSDELFVIWLFCKAGELVNIYLEGTDGTFLRSEDAKGSCQVGHGTTETPVRFPPRKLRWPANPEPHRGDNRFSVKGKGIKIERGVGTVEVGGRWFDIAVFSTVDCIDTCGIGGVGGWWELHSLLRHPDTGEVCIAIGYLSPSNASQVSFRYSICLPSLEEPTPLFAATWKGGKPREL